MYIFITCIILITILYILISRGIITMGTKSSSVNESKYLKGKTLNKDIYLKEVKNNLLCPFNLNIEPMDKLILFDVEDDPLCETIELQEFNDDISKGLVILLYRKDKEIDVYYTEGIKHDFYSGSKNGTSQLITIDNYTFEKNPDQLTFILKFTDKDNNKISVKAIEQHSDKSHFDILAPAGNMIDNFTSFPLFFMQKTAFLEKNSSEIDIEIAGNKRKPVFIPIAINGKFVFLSRYCLDPVACSLNENYKGIAESRTDFDDFQVELNEDTDRYEIKNLTCKKYEHEASIKFSPPIPELLSLKNDTKIKGRFSTTVDDTSGIVAGDYQIVKNKDKVEISIVPKKGWQPMPGKKWFKKYKWVSNISEKKSLLYVNSMWKYEN